MIMVMMMGGGGDDDDSDSILEQYCVALTYAFIRRN